MERDFKELTQKARACVASLASIFNEHVRDRGARVLWDNATVSAYMEAYHLGREDGRGEMLSIFRDGVTDPGIGDPAKFIEAHILPRLRAVVDAAAEKSGQG